jgi:hypothetical protein
MGQGSFKPPLLLEKKKHEDFTEKAEDLQTLHQ